MFAHSAVAAVSDRRRRSEIDATIRALRERRFGQCARTYVVLYRTLPRPRATGGFFSIIPNRAARAAPQYTVQTRRGRGKINLR